MKPKPRVMNNSNMPEIHVSFFEPSTLARALEQAGFRAEQPGFLRGHVDIVRFKVLKNLRIRRRSPLEALVPWPAVARLVDARTGVAAHPVGWADHAYAASTTVQP